jgi:hypothetical protein
MIGRGGEGEMEGELWGGIEGGIEGDVEDRKRIFRLI